MRRRAGRPAAVRSRDDVAKPANKAKNLISGLLETQRGLRFRKPAQTRVVAQSELRKFEMHSVFVAGFGEMSAPKKAEVVGRLHQLARAAALRTKSRGLPVWIIVSVDVERRSESVIAERIDLITAFGTVAIRASTTAS